MKAQNQYIDSSDEETNIEYSMANFIGNLSEKVYEEISEQKIDKEIIEVLQSQKYEVQNKMGFNTWRQVTYKQEQKRQNLCLGICLCLNKTQFTKNQQNNMKKDQNLMIPSENLKFQLKNEIVNFLNKKKIKQIQQMFTYFQIIGRTGDYHKKIPEKTEELSDKRFLLFENISCVIKKKNDLFWILHTFKIDLFFQKGKVYVEQIKLVKKTIFENQKLLFIFFPGKLKRHFQKLTFFQTDNQRSQYLQSTELFGKSICKFFSQKEYNWQRKYFTWRRKLKNTLNIQIQVHKLIKKAQDLGITYNSYFQINSQWEQLDRIKKQKQKNGQQVEEILMKLQENKKLYTEWKQLSMNKKIYGFCKTRYKYTAEKKIILNFQNILEQIYSYGYADEFWEKVSYKQQLTLDCHGFATEYCEIIVKQLIKYCEETVFIKKQKYLNQDFFYLKIITGKPRDQKSLMKQFSVVLKKHNLEFKPIQRSENNNFQGKQIFVQFCNPKKEQKDRNIKRIYLQAALDNIQRNNEERR